MLPRRYTSSTTPFSWDSTAAISEWPLTMASVPLSSTNPTSSPKMAVRKGLPPRTVPRRLVWSPLIVNSTLSSSSCVAMVMVTPTPILDATAVALTTFAPWGARYSDKMAAWSSSWCGLMAGPDRVRVTSETFCSKLSAMRPSRWPSSSHGLPAGVKALVR